MAIRDLVPWRRSVGNHKAIADSPLMSLQQEMNEVFDRFFEGFGLEPFDWNWNGGNGLMRPRVDVAETDDEIVVTAELPGVDEKDIEVSVEDHALTLSGERREEKESRERGYHRREQMYGAFRRTIPLPTGADPDRVSATFKRGVLTVSIGKAESGKRRRIPVQAA